MLWNGFGYVSICDRVQADLSEVNDYDKFMTLWLINLRCQLRPWPVAAKSALNFAMQVYGIQMDAHVQTESPCLKVE